MTDKERQILAEFEKIIPLLTEREKDRLLSFGQGMAFKVSGAEDVDLIAAEQKAG